MKKGLLLAFTVLLVAFLVFLFKLGSKNSQLPYDTKVVNLNSQKFNVLVADTSQKQRLGLGERKNLDANLGMIFPYHPKTIPHFWMKSMMFPIDIVWVADNKVVKIDSNVPEEPGVPDRLLKTYSPPVPIDFVVEFNAGFSERNNIKIGDSFSFES